MQEVSSEEFTAPEIKVWTHDGQGNTKDLPKPGIDHVEPISSDMQKHALFMEEMVTISVNPANIQAGEVRIFDTWVNGTRQPIIRGATQKIRRKFVEALCHAVNANYEQVFNDPSEPYTKFDMIANPSISYPISIVEDTQEGKAWFIRQMRSVQ